MKAEREKHIQTPKDWAKVYYYGDYKTAIPGSEPYLYWVVTRVNFITAKLWLADIKEKLKKQNIQNNFIPDKVNWLVMLKSFRREQETKLKEDDEK